MQVSHKPTTTWYYAPFPEGRNTHPFSVINSSNPSLISVKYFKTRIKNYGRRMIVSSMYNKQISTWNVLSEVFWRSLLTYQEVLSINFSKATEIHVSWKVIYEP